MVISVAVMVAMPPDSSQLLGCFWEKSWELTLLVYLISTMEQACQSHSPFLSPEAGHLSSDWHIAPVETVWGSYS